MNQLPSIQFVDSASNFACDVVEVYACVSHLVEYYPDFDAWYWGKVVPGLSDGTRKIDTVTRGGRVVAVLISKKTDDEKKLCTLWVDPAFIGTGVGVRLINSGRQWLGTDEPLASVPEERMPELARVLIGLGFKLTQILESAYRPGKTEYVFNGRLSALDA